MTRYPLLFDITNKKILFVGGGRVAERKILSLLKASPVITVISPEATDKIIDLHNNDKIVWYKKTFDDALAEKYDYVFIATDDRAVNDAALSCFKQAGTPVNIADSPDECDFHLPAVINDGDMVISISTDGKDPSKAKRIREKIEAWISAGGLDT